MTEASRARYVEMRQEDGIFTVALYDEARQQIAHGYKGPTLKRAEQDLKYWTRDKGLEPLPELT